MAKRLFRSKWLNEWLLFALLAIFINSFMIMKLLTLDLASPHAVAEMIQYSVRWAVPFIFLVTATSALFKLFPNEGFLWLLRNRRYVGLSFARPWHGKAPSFSLSLQRTANIITPKYTYFVMS
ncbi:hypothetical protein N9C62_03715 [Luminiphilus sp.]|nr:hypothetical protein [Luminiphilus sp.]